MILDCTAEYIPDGDTILATAYVIDSSDVLHPEQVTLGTAEILHLGVAIAPVINFDKRMGNSDGAFRFTVSHPVKTKNLQFRVTVTLVDTTFYSKTVNISTDGEEEIPLSYNKAATTEDFRSKKRIDEGL